jgi:hypothetical protein
MNVEQGSGMLASTPPMGRIGAVRDNRESKFLAAI